MFVVDAKTVRSLDARAIESGIEGIELMETAGAGAARAALDHPSWLWGTTLIVCGAGNNGGDALVVARLLHGEGHRVRVLLLAEENRYRGDAATNLARAKQAEVPLICAGEDAAAALERLDREEPGRLLVDGILGTGFHPPLEGRLLELVEAVNATGRRVLSLDVPSGLDATTGAVQPTAVVADLTVTFGLAKWGLFLPPGRSHAGHIERVDLGIPLEMIREQVKESEGAGLYVDQTLAAGWWRPRAIDAHKYSVGSLLVVGGSMGMSGAVSLACLGAMRAGAGLVEAMVPGSQRLSVDTACLEVLVRPCSETTEGGLSPEVLPEILERSRRHRAVLLGVGMGADLSTASLACEAAAALEIPMVVDADGLNAFSRLQKPMRLPRGSVITPHSGELKRLRPGELDLEGGRVKTLRRLSAELGCVLLHKGAPTMVAAPDQEVAVIASGNQALASAGTGDVLAGVIAALLAAGLPAFEAAGLGAYLHGRAADRVSAKVGEAGLLARDLLDELGAAGRELQERVR